MYYVRSVRLSFMACLQEINTGESVFESVLLILIDGRRRALWRATACLGHRPCRAAWNGWSGDGCGGLVQGGGLGCSPTSAAAQVAALLRATTSQRWRRPTVADDSAIGRGGSAAVLMIGAEGGTLHGRRWSDAAAIGAFSDASLAVGLMLRCWAKVSATPWSRSPDPGRVACEADDDGGDCTAVGVRASCREAMHGRNDHDKEITARQRRRRMTTPVRMRRVVAGRPRRACVANGE